MEKIPIAHAGIFSILDGIDSHLHFAWIIVWIIESDFIGIESNSDSERFEYASRFVCHRNVLVNQYLRTKDIFGDIFRDSAIRSLIRCSQPIFSSCLDIDRTLDITQIIDHIPIFWSQRL